MQDEKLLHDWVKSDPANLAILHAWEKEWEASESDNISAKWGEMLGRIAVRQTVEEGQLRLGRRNHGWMFASIAAAALLFAAVSVYLFSPAFNTAPQIYCTEAPAGEKCRVVLPDSTMVWLNYGSKLSDDDSYNRK